MKSSFLLGILLLTLMNPIQSSEPSPPRKKPPLPVAEQPPTKKARIETPQPLSVIITGNHEAFPEWGGRVGFVLMQSQLLSHLIIHTPESDYSQGEAEDLEDANSASIQVSALEDLHDIPHNNNALIFISSYDEEVPATVQRLQQTVQSCAQAVDKFKDGCLLIATPRNVPLFCAAALHLCEQIGLLTNPHKQIMGLGTWIESRRLQVQISKELEVERDAITQYDVLGIRHTGLVVPWSRLQVNGEVAVVPDDIKAKIQAYLTGCDANRISDGAFPQVLYATCIKNILREMYDQPVYGGLPLLTNQSDAQAFINLPVQLSLEGVGERVEFPLSTEEQAELKAVVEQTQKVQTDFVANLDAMLAQEPSSPQTEFPGAPVPKE